MNKKYHLHLKGYVGSYDFDSDYVDFVLEKNSDKDVDVLIDSLGGSLNTALTIAAAFRNHGKVNVHFVGMNASAATIASLGARHISIDSNAMYLVHKCSSSFFQWGSMNADQLQEKIEEYKKMKNDLDKFDGNVAEMYASKCKKHPKDLLKLMKVGGWLTAKEAMEWGFIDEITDSKEDENPVLTDKLVACMNEAGIPIPEVKNIDHSLLDSIKNMLGLGKHETKQVDDIDDSNTSEPENTSEETAEDNEETTQTDIEKTENDNQSQTSNTVIEMKTLKFICALLALDALAFEDGKVTLTEEQLGKIEDELAQKDNLLAERKTSLENKDSELTALKNELETLKKAPADHTTHVVDDEAKNEKTDVENYFENLQAAKDLFERV